MNKDTKDTPMPDETINGLLCLKVLYIGSKSEDQYPILIDANSLLYRIYVKGSRARIDPNLNVFMNNHVSIKGKCDMLRGHLRIVIDWSIADVIQINESPLESNKPSLNTSDLQPKKKGKSIQEGNAND